MKKIKRFCIDTEKMETFVMEGSFANGNGAYSRITINDKGEDEIKYEDECAYYQVRYNGKLIMCHI